MTDILGHDIDGRPLRAGDEVIHLRSDDKWSARFLNRVVAITGRDEIEPEYMTTSVTEGPRVLIVDGTDVRKIHNDHRPAYESFSDMISKLKGETA